MRRLRWVLLSARALSLSACVLCFCGCVREGGRDATREQPVGGASALAAALKAAQRGADPNGAILIVLWTVAAPPTKELRDLADRWAPHGLTSLAISVEPLLGATRDEAIVRVRGWERRNRVGLPGMIFTGDEAALARQIDGARPRAGLVLLDAQGIRIWSSDGFADLEALDAVLQAHLGEPNVAGGHDGCPCAGRLSGPMRAGSAEARC